MSKSLEDELSIPAEATLLQSPPCCLKMSGGGEVKIAVETSLRASKQPRCLVVGRQANTADLRIQHGSISRRHAALYYINNNLTIQDLGGKHGVHVNGNRVEAKGSFTLNDGDAVIFGNVRENVFTVQVPVAATKEEGEPSEEKPDFENKEPVQEPGAGLTGRAKREAEIAAMMASLEQKPTYTKFQPTEPPIEDSKQAPSLNVSSKEETHGLPVSEQFTLSYFGEESRRRIVSCLAVDPAGSRFVAGGTDMNLRFYDFAGMDRYRTDPFKTVVVEDGHVIVNACYSNTGDRLLVATGSVQPKVLDRDGHEIIQFVRGDMYVTDPARTMGHTAAVTGVAWHPLERDIVLTSSIDGSARLWNLSGKTQFKKLVCDKVYRAKSERGQRVAATAVAFHPGGRELAFGTACGSIQIWNATRVGARPERVVFHAHGDNRAIHSLVYNTDGSRLASRSMDDDTVKVWDAKRLSKSASPIVTCTGLPSDYEHCNSAFSPDGRVLCAGSSEPQKLPNQQRSEVGKLKFFHVPRDRDESAEKRGAAPFLEFDMAQGVGVIVVKWHSKLNQIFVGCSDGSTIVFFDRTLSSKGALLPSSKGGRPVDELSRLLASRAPTGSAGIRGEVLTPNALPMFREKERLTKRQREKELADPVKSRRPEAPSTGIKTGGQSSVSVSFSQFVSKSIVKTKNIAGKDPREELFKYSEGKNYVTQAYEGDKEKVLADTTVEQEEEEIRSKKKPKIN